MGKTEPELSHKQNNWMAVKFVLFSISAGVIETVSYFLLDEYTHIDDLLKFGGIFGNKYGLTYFIALVLSVLWNFTFNRKFTFKSAANVPIAMLKIFGYYLVFTPVSIWWTVRLTDLNWNGWNGFKEYVVLLGTMLLNLVTEFLFDRFVVYRNNLFTNEEGKRELSEIIGDNNINKS